MATAALVGTTQALELYAPTNTPAPAIISTDVTPLWRTIVINTALILSIINTILILCDRLKPACHNLVETNARLSSLESELYICLYSNSKYLHLKIKTLPYDLQAITAAANAEVKNFYTIWRGMCGYLYVDWSPLELATETNRIIPPAEIQLPWNTYTGCRHLTTDFHTVRVLLLQADQAWAISSWTKLSSPRSGLPLPYSRLRTTEEQSPMTASLIPPGTDAMDPTRVRWIRPSFNEESGAAAANATASATAEDATRPKTTTVILAR
jgi:hypothetical protein